MSARSVREDALHATVRPGGLGDGEAVEQIPAVTGALGAAGHVVAHVGDGGRLLAGHIGGLVGSSRGLLHRTASYSDFEDRIPWETIDELLAATDGTADE